CGGGNPRPGGSGGPASGWGAGPPSDQPRQRPPGRAAPAAPPRGARRREGARGADARLPQPPRPVGELPDTLHAALGRERRDARCYPPDGRGPAAKYLIPAPGVFAMEPQRSEHAAALRSSVERVCGLVASENLEMLGLERETLEQALAGLIAAAEGLRAERDDARLEKRRAELELAATRQVLGNGPDGFIITDRAGIILQANPAATQLLGVSGRFLLRKPLSLFIDEVDLRMFRWRVNNAQAWNQG